MPPYGPPAAAGDGVIPSPVATGEGQGGGCPLPSRWHTRQSARIVDDNTGLLYPIGVTVMQAVRGASKSWLKVVTGRRGV